MTQITIPLKDDALQTEIEAAFADSYSNPDSLSASDLVALNISNYVRQILNNYRQKVAVQSALNGVVVADSLTE